MMLLCSSSSETLSCTTDSSENSVFYSHSIENITLYSKLIENRILRQIHPKHRIVQPIHRKSYCTANSSEYIVTYSKSIGKYRTAIISVALSQTDTLNSALLLPLSCFKIFPVCCSPQLTLARTIVKSS